MNISKSKPPLSFPGWHPLGDYAFLYHSGMNLEGIYISWHILLEADFLNALMFRTSTWRGGWQQSSKRLPAGTMPSVVKVHTEESPRAAREVERLSRNPEKTGERGRQLEAGWNSFVILKTISGGFVRWVSMRWQSRKGRLKSDVKPCQLGRQPGDEVTEGRASLQTPRLAASSYMYELEGLVEDGIGHLRALSSGWLMMIMMMILWIRTF